MNSERKVNMGRSDRLRCLGKRTITPSAPLNNCCKAMTSYIGNEYPVNFDNKIATKAATAPWQNMRKNVFRARIPRVLLMTEMHPADIASATTPIIGENCNPKKIRLRKRTNIGLRACPTNEVAGVLFSIMKKTIKAPTVVKKAAKTKSKNSLEVGILKLSVPREIDRAINPLRKNNGPIGSNLGSSSITFRVNTVPMLTESTASRAKITTIIPELFHSFNGLE